MIPIVNLNMMIEKELDLEKQGLRRTKRWIGDFLSKLRIMVGTKQK